MSKRYGRNQRRRHLAALKHMVAVLDQQLSYGRGYIERARRAEARVEEYEARDRKISRAPVRLTVENIYEYQRGLLQLRASIRPQDLHLVELIDRFDVAMREKREEFVVDVAFTVAERLYLDIAQRFGVTLDATALRELLEKRAGFGREGSTSRERYEAFRQNPVSAPPRS